MSANETHCDGLSFSENAFVSMLLAYCIFNVNLFKIIMFIYRIAMSQVHCISGRQFPNNAGKMSAIKLDMKT